MAGTLSYISPSHYWTSVYFEKDPALMSAMAIAGQIFLRGAITPASHPLTYVLGAESLFDFTALNGSNLARATYTQGARIRFQPDSNFGTIIEGQSSISLDAPPTGAIAMGDQVLWDWPNGRLIIDTPMAKVYTGTPHGNYRFKDGIVAGGFADSFVSFGMISADGKPLTGANATASIYASAANDAKNTGYHIRFSEANDPMPSGGPLGIGKLIDNNGTSPTIVDRVPYQLWFPTDLSGEFRGYDFARRQRIVKLVEGGHIIHDGSELYLASISITKPGRAIPTPASDEIVAELQKMSSPGEALTGSTTNITLWNPLPHVSWMDPIYSIESQLRAAGRHLDAATLTADHLHFENTDAIFQSSADIDVLYHRGRMSSINVTFKTPPILFGVIAEYDNRFGPAVQKHIAASEDQVSTVQWIQTQEKSTLTITLTETQGTLGIAYSITP